MSTRIRVILSETELSEMDQIYAELKNGGIVDMRDFDGFISFMVSAGKKAEEVGPDWEVQQGDLNQSLLCA